MSGRITTAALAAALSMILGTAASQACIRQYLVTYGYYTPEKGELEVEQWTDVFVSRDGGTSYRSKTEIEYGVSDRLVTALYLVSKKPEGRSFDYAETKLQLRYRLNEPGRRFWDAAGYLELVRPSDSDEPYEMEVKGIFSHEFPRFNLSFNIIGEKKLRGGEETELGYAIGVAPHADGRTTYSLEAFGSERSHYIMPAFWIRPGKTHNVGFGIAKGLTAASDRMQIRTLYAVEF